MREESEMAKVLIVNPIIRAEDDPRHVPYGLALLAGVANREGHQIQVFDSNGWRPSDEELVEAIQADDWDVIRAARNARVQPDGERRRTASAQRLPPKRTTFGNQKRSGLGRNANLGGRLTIGFDQSVHRLDFPTRH